MRDSMKAALPGVERVEGVREARFSYQAAEGFVTFDTTVTTIAEIVRELQQMTDFSATERADEGD